MSRSSKGKEVVVEEPATESEESEQEQEEEEEVQDVADSDDSSVESVDEGSGPEGGEEEEEGDSEVEQEEEPVKKSVGFARRSQPVAAKPKAAVIKSKPKPKPQPVEEEEEQEEEEQEEEEEEDTPVDFKGAKKYYKQLEQFGVENSREIRNLWLDNIRFMKSASMQSGGKRHRVDWDSVLKDKELQRRFKNIVCDAMVDYAK